MLQRHTNVRGSWSAWQLLRRTMSVTIASPPYMLFVQPWILGVAINLVCTEDSTIANKAFLGYIAALWLGCNNAAQGIVRERPILLREMLAGLRVHNYLIAKFLWFSFVAFLQAMILFLILDWFGRDLVGDPTLQFVAMVGSAMALTGVGLAISAFAKTETQAVLWVPVVIIPQILLSGFVFSLNNWKESWFPKVAAHASPSFAAQRLFDISFWWNQPISETSQYSSNYGLMAPHISNLEHSLLPIDVLLFDNQREWVLSAKRQSSVYAADDSPAEFEDKEIKPGSRPKFSRDYRYHDTRAAIYPIVLFAIWYAGSFFATLFYLKRLTHD